MKVILIYTQNNNKSDGKGLPSLSPKVLGPVDHKQSDLPIAKTIEGYHQFNKVFPFEINEKGGLLPSFIERQIYG